MPRVVASGRLSRVAPVDKDHATRGTYKKTLMIRVAYKFFLMSYISHTAWYLIQSCWRRAVDLGRVVPPRRAIPDHAWSFILELGHAWFYR